MCHIRSTAAVQDALNAAALPNPSHKTAQPPTYENPEPVVLKAASGRLEQGRARAYQLRMALCPYGIAYHSAMSLRCYLPSHYVPTVLPTTGSPTRVGLSIQAAKQHKAQDGPMLQGLALPSDHMAVCVLILE